MKANWKTTLLCGLLAVAGQAQAAPIPCTGGTLTCYIGLDAGSTDPTVNPAGNPRTNANAAQSAFAAALDPASVKVDTFESANVGDLTPTFPGPLVKSSASTTNSVGGGATSAIKNSSTDGTLHFGRFNTTSGGSKWWETSYDFSFTLQQPVSAFGFYATDVGDFDGTLNLILTAVGGEQIVLNDVVPDSTSAANGALLFFGVSDSVRKFSGMSFRIGQTATSGPEFDAIGFDDMTTGNLKATDPNPVPEPASLALAGLALASLAAVRRRKPA
jgi:hypothetical protein